jgi:hypothetical protein
VNVAMMGKTVNSVQERERSETELMVVVENHSLGHKFKGLCLRQPHR